MKKILLASHGKLASGIKSSIEILTGVNEQIISIDAYLPNDNSDYTPIITSFIDSIKMDDEAIIFTDIAMGSVNQKMIELMSKTNKEIYLISGMNLPIVLSIILESRKIKKEIIDELLELCKVTHINIKDLKEYEDEDFF